MKYFVKLTTALAGFLIIAITCQGQNVIATSGAQASDANYDLCWTIGEPLITTLTNENLVLTQGFHQSKLTVSSLITNPKLANSFLVYPNPVQSEITIDFGTFNAHCQIVVRNNAGKVIAMEKYTGNFQTNKLSFKAFQQGIYLLQILSNSGTLLQSNKIVKI